MDLVFVFVVAVCWPSYSWWCFFYMYISFFLNMFFFRFVFIRLECSQHQHRVDLSLYALSSNVHLFISKFKIHDQSQAANIIPTFTYKDTALDLITDHFVPMLCMAKRKRKYKSYLFVCLFVASFCFCLSLSLPSSSLWWRRTNTTRFVIIIFIHKIVWPVGPLQLIVVIVIFDILQWNCPKN